MPGALATLASNGAWRYARHLELIEDKLLDILAGRETRVMFSLPPQHGKLIVYGAPVWTPNGLKNHGDLRPGDFVFGLDGRPTRVVATGNHGYATHSVTFSDGASLQCHENHEWFVYDTRRHKHRTLTTGELLRAGVRYVDGVTDRGRFFVPNYEPLQLRRRVLPIPPYLLGVWLGDGRRADGSLTLNDTDAPEIIDRIKSLGYSIQRITRQGTTVVLDVIVRCFKQQLQSLRLLDNKHVPEAYLYSSIEQRRELLAGLFDTDGHWATSSGQCVIVNTNPRIVSAVEWLVRSLGYHVGTSWVDPQTSTSGIVGKRRVAYIRFSPRELLPTAVTRKQPKRLSRVHRRRAIVAIERLAKPVPGNCIQVAAADGVYLVGETLIPTHNSTLISHYFPAFFLGRNPTKHVLLASYESTFAMGWGRRARDVLERYGPSVFGVNVSTATRAANHWETTEGGSMTTAGAGGSITGRPADCLTGDAVLYTDAGPATMAEVIERAQVDDRLRVLSYSHRRGQLEYKRVVATRITETRDVVKLTMGDPGKALIATPRHQVFVYGRGKGYTQARSVFGGDTVLRLTGGALRRRKLRYAIQDTLDRPETVYDLQVAENHNYIANDMLVHNCFIIDDPIKNQQEALSVSKQDMIEEWYKTTVYTRQSPNAAVLIIMTRWSDNDLVGRLLEAQSKGGDQWTYINLPAIAIEGEEDPLGRAPGEALWPERYPVEWLEQRRRVQGDFWFNAMYQGRPTPRAGYVVNIDWFRRYNNRPDRSKVDMVVLSFDTAQKDTELNDYTVCTVWFIVGNAYYLIDLIRDRYTHPRLLALASNLISLWRPNAVIIEDRGSGTSLLQHLEGQAPVVAVNPQTGGSKVVRMQVESPAIEAGQVWLPADGSVPWLQDLLTELRSFPNSPYKDQVDSISQFLRWAREQRVGIDMW